MQDKDHLKEDSEKNASMEDGQIPSRCPFSGVFFDPSLLKEWQSKMKISANDGDAVSQLHSFHKQMMQQNMNHMKDNEAKMGTENDESVQMMKKTTMRRVHITNSQSKRTKELFLEPSSSQTVWEAIYNNPAVKDANIRKWNSGTVEGVKEGTKEIRLKICGGSSPKMYTLADLKGLSTEDLFRQSLSILIDSDTMDNQEDFVLKLQLCCVDI